MSELNIKNSSNLQKATYDDETKILIVEFKNGSSYRYFNVPKTLWDQFAKTVNEDGSAGKFLNAHIRSLPNEKVEE